MQDERTPLGSVFNQRPRRVAFGLHGGHCRSGILHGVSWRGLIGVDDVEYLEHFAGLLGAVANHHAADAGVAQCAAALFEIAHDVVEHRFDKFRMGVDELALDIALLKFNRGERFLQ